MKLKTLICDMHYKQLTFSKLGSNKIKKMNGIAFANLPQLAELDVTDNVCIDVQFFIKDGLNKLRRIISKRCGSTDVAEKLLCNATPLCEIYRVDSNESEDSDEVIENKSICCELEHGTVVDGSDYTFAAYANYTNVEILIIEHQQNVEFLPVLVHERFPKLRIYHVINTPISKISKKNFEKMYKLEELTLDRNQIEIIRSDTFKDLVNLKWIEISTNIVFLNFCNGTS